MASISSPDYPGERLIVCRNAELAAERTRKREDLLAATERDLGRIEAAVARKRAPLQGTAEIALAVGAVVDRYKMRKHFDLMITDTSFRFARKSAVSNLEICRACLGDDRSEYRASVVPAFSSFLCR